MKTWLGLMGLTLALLMSGLSVQAALPVAKEAAPAEWNPLLQRYVKGQGVRYAAWHQSMADRAALDRVVQFFAESKPPTQPQEALAWHLNAYNAWIIHQILASYPTKGPLHGQPRFFQEPRIRISGETLSFDDLEKKRILPLFRDPRIHFAVNCAAAGCPPLHHQAFQGSTLEHTLDHLTRQFISQNPQGLDRQRNRVRLSKIFEWYASDFGGRNNLIAYVNRYLEKPIPTNMSIEFLEYDWSLNESR